MGPGGGKEAFGHLVRGLALAMHNDDRAGYQACLERLYLFLRQDPVQYRLRYEVSLIQSGVAKCL